MASNWDTSDVIRYIWGSKPERKKIDLAVDFACADETIVTLPNGRMIRLNETTKRKGITMDQQPEQALKDILAKIDKLESENKRLASELKSAQDDNDTVVVNRGMLREYISKQFSEPSPCIRISLLDAAQRRGMDWLVDKIFEKK